MLHRIVKLPLTTICKRDLSETDTALLECYLNTNFSCIVPSHFFFFFFYFPQGEVSPSSSTGSGIKEHEAGPTCSSRDAGMALEWECVGRWWVSRKSRLFF